MDNIESLLIDILEELRTLNSSIKDITGDGIWNLQDIHDEIQDIHTELEDTNSSICEKLDGIRGNGLYDTIADVCDKLDLLD